MEPDPALSQATFDDGVMERLRFRRAPLAAACLWLAAGIGLARVVYEPVLVLVCAAVLLVGLSVVAILRAPRVGWLAVAGVWVVVGMFAGEFRAPVAGVGGLDGYRDGLSREVRGRVLRVRELPPEVKAGGDQLMPWEMAELPEVGSGAGVASLDLAVEQIERVTPDVAEMVAAQGGVRVTVYGPILEDVRATQGLGEAPGRRVGSVGSVGPVVQARRQVAAREQWPGEGLGQVQAQRQAERQRLRLRKERVEAEIRARAERQAQEPEPGPEPELGPVQAPVQVHRPVIRCGDEVTVALRVKELERFRDPGAWQYADYLEGQGIVARASVAGKAVSEVRAGVGGWPCRLAGAQGWASGRLARYVDSAENRGLPGMLRLTRDDAGMLDAMLFGDRAGLNHGLRVGFERTGSFHLFVVSGLHIALLAAGVFWGMRRLRAPEWVATLVTLAAAWGYAALTGFGQPAQRSLGMIAVFLVARLMSRGRNSLNALGAAGIAMLLWAPGSLFEASLQMTLLAVVAIAGLAIPLWERSLGAYAHAAGGAFQPRGRVVLRPALAQFRLGVEMWGEAVEERLGWGKGVPRAVVRWGAWAAELALIGVVTEMVMALPMAMYFHRATVFALPANMAVLPVVGVLAPLGVATFLGSVVGNWAAVVPGAATAGVLHGVTWVIGVFGRLKGADLRVPGPVWWVGLVAVAGWLAGCWLVRRSGWGAVVTACLLPAIAAVVLWPEAAVRTAGRLEVTAIDVGQGDSELVVGPGGLAMLVDAGGPVGQHGSAEVVTRFDVGGEVVSPYLWSRRLRRLDVMVLTHAHSDHMGGMPAVMENFRPRELWVSGTEPDSGNYRALLAEARRLGVRVRTLRAGDTVDWAGVGVRVLSPARGYVNAGAAKNDDSLVLEMSYGKARVLLEGDAETPSEETMVAAGLVRPVTLLKVGHHGSKTSSTEGFLEAAHATDAVVSVGRGNAFGHPRGDVVQRIGGMGTRLWRTDEMGLSTFLLGVDGGVDAVYGSAVR